MSRLVSQDRNSRGSVQVELVAVLDVEHEISSVQELHYEEEVLLDREGREIGQQAGVRGL